MSIKFRIATERDCDLMFKWVNDEKVRANAFRSKVIRYDEHKEWFKKKIASDTTKIFIASRNNEDIGQIRIDIEERIGTIDYSIAKCYRGKGYGVELLTGITRLIKEYKIPVVKLVGKVKYANTASKKAFIKAGYTEERKEEFIEFSKQT
ncbi:GNAT family N-acetyltransferase [Clostridium formicaceticum]|uniref:N-acetyltransferase domain-containing protein n=1 Tax=Clostridium formicaceticum TaxID=1497 RepID=A0AAC9RI88_9CLOT|nr:GNAT family N-acetyltransferase [Clostridium formicaceticum]AOY75666.1 hypothetical protein BJL90_07020 [Clostridium formicaceticum]ARE85982.1 hypothetical protein CLFO_02980 [Clostridium formicaceticum]